jgi:hypothetical protein
MFGLLVVGAMAPLVIIPLIPSLSWPKVTAWGIGGVALVMVGYALALLPTRLVISDDGIWQKLLCSELRLRWEDMVEWRHCDGGAEFEDGQQREWTKNRWHSIEFWVKDKAGRKHHFKRWLVFGRRSKQIAGIMRERGIEGG